MRVNHRRENFAALFAALVITMTAPAAVAQEAITPEVRVEASFSSGLQMRPNPAVSALLERLELRDEERRAVELHDANKSGATRVLELLKLPAWIPFGLGSSENRVDHFFLQNYMRPDLNPRDENRLFRAE